MVRGGFKSIDFANAGILVFVFFGNINFALQNLLDFLFVFQCFVVKMNVKSYPLEELLVNLASWTP